MTTTTATAASAQAEIKPATDYAVMIDSLQQDDLSTSFSMVEITKMTYLRDSQFGSVEFDGGGRLTLTEWSARQLCKISGVPYGVWVKGSEKLASDMFGEFLPMVKEPNRKLVVRSRGNKTTLRGILPIDYPDIRNSSVLKAVGDACNTAMTVVSANWLDEVNTPLFRTRFVMNGWSFHVKSLKQDLYLGVDCLSSEVGAGPLQVNLLLYVPICTNGAIAVFGKKSYFHYDYATAPLMTIDDIMPLCMQRLEGSLHHFHQVAEQAAGHRITLAEAKALLLSMAEKNQLNKGVALKSIVEMEKNSVNSLWDVGNAITATARGYRDTLRLRYEIAAGALMGFEFARNSKHEVDWVSHVPAYALPALPPMPSVTQTVVTP